MKKSFIHIMACSNLGTRILLTFFADTDYLRVLISDALFKLFQCCTRDEYFKIEHVDSISHLHDMKE